MDLTFLQKITRENFFAEALRNQILEETVLFNMLTSGGHTRTATGTALTWPITAHRASAVGVYEGADVLPNQSINPIETATLSYAQYSATVSITGKEERENSGNMEKLLDMLTIKYKNAKDTLLEQQATHAYGSATSIGGKNIIVGTAAAVAAANTYAGVDRTDAANAFFLSTIDSTGHAKADLVDSTDATHYFPTILMTAWLATSHFGKGAGLMILTPDIYTMYTTIATTLLRLNDNRVANLGFGAIKWGPDVTMVFDRYQTAYRIDVLTLDDWYLSTFPGASWDFDGWKVPSDQDAKEGHFLWHGQLSCVEPRRQAALTNVASS
jgi:hypothetical protein